MNHEDLIEQLTEADLLTRRQAEVWVSREVEGLSRSKTAEKMDISPYTVDDYLADAREKIERARGTVEILDRIEKNNSEDEDNTMIPDKIEIEKETVIDARMREWAFESGGGIPQTKLDIVRTGSGVTLEIFTEDSTSRPKGLPISPSRFIQEDSRGMVPPFEDWGEMQHHCEDHEQDFDDCWEAIEEIERGHVRRDLADEIRPDPRGRDDLGGIEIEYVDE
ncbi:hypothetical protein HTSR_0936 [Halodesulfurarchaeum formicicum]|uniref:Uncharacterized protein n=1 Tax=Halodesulfurarchaeum formicicum TaxID=1873524 RepID=A0A1D8S445_9EURY|nr:hypothetical protein [Halodesulfurarchaeum formicicum]AOW80121.1 hypothetical protein HTSR_0936 [Halodesulfurarchaeum formicicum]